MSKPVKVLVPHFQGKVLARFYDRIDTKGEFILCKVKQVDRIAVAYRNYVDLYIVDEVQVPDY